MKYFVKLWHNRLGRPFRLAYLSYPGTGVPVVLLHGIASNKEFWLPLVDELAARGRRVIVPDLLGHGGSPSPDYIDYSTADQAKAVIALLNKLRVRQYVLVGHSMGSLVASRIASLRPDAAAKLILYEPPLFADIPDFKTHHKRRQFYFGIYDKIAQNPNKRLTMTKLVARISNNWTKYLASEQTWLPIERSLRNSIMDQTSYEELRDIAIDTDIVHGRLDVVVSRTGLRKMFGHNDKIKFYKTTDRHKLSNSSAKFLAGLLQN